MCIFDERKDGVHVEFILKKLPVTGNNLPTEKFVTRYGKMSQMSPKAELRHGPRKSKTEILKNYFFTNSQSRT